jgi:AraC-like DNA-binding protein
MKLLLEKLTLEPKYSFVLQKDVYPYYPTPWHYHPEYELVLVVKSTGQRIVGDHVDNFSDGDLVFMGPNLPHVYNNDSIYYEGHKDLKAEAIVIHFREDFLGKDFFKVPEMMPVMQLLERSQCGMKIMGKTRKVVAAKMQDLLKMRGPSRLIHLLSTLEILATSEEYRLLASPGFVNKYNTSGTERMTKVYDYIMNHFKEDIRLEEVAEISNMTAPSFCRFFKACTRKNFSRFLNEIRIGYACKLLQEGHFSIAEICYESGFNNLSNFNRQFKKIMDKSPLEYRKAQGKGV